MIGTTARSAVVLVSVCIVLAASACVAQTLETETARPLGKGVWDVGSAYEHQISSEGNEIGVPFAAEYGLTNLIDFLVEPVFYAAIDPADSHPGPHATGIGDLEMTLTFMARKETMRMPAFALAGEVKLPTARNSLIGTGRADETVYVIASKRLGRLDTHANISYAFIGQPQGVQLNNVYGFAVAGVYERSKRITYFGEVLGNTAASAENDAVNGSVVPGAVAVEAPGAELVGTLGIGTSPRPDLFVSFAVSYDNNTAVMFRPGLVLTIH